jgi:hypothetical protein
VGVTDDQPSFTCPVCGTVSYSLDDVREGYCGNCHAFTGVFGRSGEEGRQVEAQGPEAASSPRRGAEPDAPEASP